MKIREKIQILMLQLTFELRPICFKQLSSFQNLRRKGGSGADFIGHGGMGVFRGGPRGPRPPPIEIFFALFKYSLSSFLPNHMYSLCRIA